MTWWKRHVGTVGLTLMVAGTPTAAEVEGPARMESPGGLSPITTGVREGGVAWASARFGPLQIDKEITPGGSSTLRLDDGIDPVTIAVGPEGYRVTRGARTVAFRPGEDDDTARDRVRGLLLGSRSVRAFKALAVSLDESTPLRDPMEFAMLLDIAMVAGIDGDDTAARRVGQRLRSWAQDRQQYVAAGGGQFTDCLTEYYLSLLDSWDEYTACYDPLSFWSLFWWGPVCSFELFIRAQQYIFQFVTCSTVPF